MTAVKQQSLCQHVKPAAEPVPPPSNWLSHLLWRGLPANGPSRLILSHHSHHPLLWKVPPALCPTQNGHTVSSKWDFPGGASNKGTTCRCGRHKRHGFDPWVGKILWRRTWQPTPVFLPGESSGQRSLVGSQRLGPHTCIPWQ